VRGVIEEVPDLDRLLDVDLVCRVLIGALGAHPLLPRSTSAREKVAELMVLLCPCWWAVSSSTPPAVVSVWVSGRSHSGPGAPSPLPAL